MSRGSRIAPHCRSGHGRYRKLLRKMESVPQVQRDSGRRIWPNDVSGTVDTSHIRVRRRERRCHRAKRTEPRSCWNIHAVARNRRRYRAKRTEPGSCRNIHTAARNGRRNGAGRAKSGSGRNIRIGWIRWNRTVLQDLRDRSREPAGTSLLFRFQEQMG